MEEPVTAPAGGNKGGVFVVVIFFGIGVHMGMSIGGSIVRPIAVPYSGFIGKVAWLPMAI